jgi:hypothetical protein
VTPENYPRPALRLFTPGANHPFNIRIGPQYPPWPSRATLLKDYAHHRNCVSGTCGWDHCETVDAGSRSRRVHHHRATRNRRGVRGQIHRPTAWLVQAGGFRRIYRLGSWRNRAATDLSSAVPPPSRGIVDTHATSAPDTSTVPACVAAAARWSRRRRGPRGPPQRTPSSTS